MIKPVIEVGKGIVRGREFRAWLEAQGYPTDAPKSNACYVDLEDITQNIEAAEIWQSLWDQFKVTL
jgi:hypothetical protein